MTTSERRLKFLKTNLQKFLELEQELHPHHVNEDENLTYEQHIARVKTKYAPFIKEQTLHYIIAARSPAAYTSDNEKYGKDTLCNTTNLLRKAIRYVELQQTIESIRTNSQEPQTEIANFISTESECFNEEEIENAVRQAMSDIANCVVIPQKTYAAKASENFLWILELMSGLLAGTFNLFYGVYKYVSSRFDTTANRFFSSDTSLEAHYNEVVETVSLLEKRQKQLFNKPTILNCTNYCQAMLEPDSEHFSKPVFFKIAAEIEEFNELATKKTILFPKLTELCENKKIAEPYRKKIANIWDNIDMESGKQLYCEKIAHVLGPKKGYLWGSYDATLDRRVFIPEVCERLPITNTNPITFSEKLAETKQLVESLVDHINGTIIITKKTRTQSK